MDFPRICILLGNIDGRERAEEPGEGKGYRVMGEKEFPQVNILRRVRRPGVKYDRTPDASGVLAPKEPGVGRPGVKI